MKQCLKSSIDIQGIYIITDYCVLDFESNGGNNEYNRIIEIGCIRVRNFNVNEVYKELAKITVINSVKYAKLTEPRTKQKASYSDNTREMQLLDGHINGIRRLRYYSLYFGENTQKL